MARVSNLISKQFGRLTVVKRGWNDSNHNAQWWCACSCDRIYVLVPTPRLRVGMTRSCGCLKREVLTKRWDSHRRKPENDLTGMVFGRLTVISRDGCGVWICECSCERKNLTRVQFNNLRGGNVKSCGCLRRERMRKECGVASFNRLFANYKAGARHRGLKWDLSADVFTTLIHGNCAYDGTVPSRTMNGPNGSLLYNGIDRINNNEGYTVENCVSCCFECNQRKSTSTESDFLNWIKRSYEYRYGAVNGNKSSTC